MANPQVDLPVYFQTRPNDEELMKSAGVERLEFQCEHIARHGPLWNDLYARLEQAK